MFRSSLRWLTLGPSQNLYWSVSRTGTREDDWSLLGENKEMGCHPMAGLGSGAAVRRWKGESSVKYQLMEANLIGCSPLF